MVKPYVELRSATEKIGGIADVSDVHDAISRSSAKRTSAGNWAAQIPETGGGISSGRELSHWVSRNGIRELRYDIVAELCRLHRVHLRGRSRLSQALKSSEKESSVLENGPTDGVTILILANVGHRRGEHIACGQCPILVVIRQRAMEAISTLSRDHVNTRSRIAALLRRKVVRYYTDLLDRFGVRNGVDCSAVGDAVDAGVVDGKAVG